MKEVDYRTNQAPKVPVLHEGDAARDLSAMKPGHLLTSLWQHQLGLQEPYDRHVHHTGVEHRHVAARRHREPDRGLSETKLKPEEGFSSALWKHFQSLQEPFDRHRDLTPRTPQDAKLSQIQLDSYARVQKAVCVASLPPLMTRSGSAPCVPSAATGSEIGLQSGMDGSTAYDSSSSSASSQDLSSARHVTFNPAEAELITISWNPAERDLFMSSQTPRSWHEDQESDDECAQDQKCSVM